jgi:hypothetical protein
MCRLGVTEWDVLEIVDLANPVAAQLAMILPGKQSLATTDLAGFFKLC